MQVLLFLAIALTVFCGIAVLFAPMLLKPSPEAARILEMVQTHRSDRRKIGSTELLQDGVLKLARGLRATAGSGGEYEVEEAPG